MVVSTVLERKFSSIQTPFPSFYHRRNTPFKKKKKEAETWYYNEFKSNLSYQTRICTLLD